MKSSPCLKCPASPCGAYHDECSTYQEWREEWNKEKAQHKNYIHLNKQIQDIKYFGVHRRTKWN